MWDHNFGTGTVLKGPLQSELYGIAEQVGIISNAEIIVGPPNDGNLERHLLDARTKIAKTEKSIVRIVEIEESIHKEQDEALKHLGDCTTSRPKLWLSKVKRNGLWISDGYYALDHNVSLYLGDIADAPPERFIDADLMGTVSTIGDTIKRTLLRQRSTFSSGKFLKGFIFTVCVRPVGWIKTRDWLVEELLPVLGCNGCKIGDKKFRLTEDPKSRVSAKGFKGVSAHWFEEIFYSNRCNLENIALCQYHDDAMPMLTGLLTYR